MLDNWTEEKRAQIDQVQILPLPVILVEIANHSPLDPYDKLAFRMGFLLHVSCIVAVEEACFATLTFRCISVNDVMCSPISFSSIFVLVIENVFE